MRCVQCAAGEPMHQTHSGSRPEAPSTLPLRHAFTSSRYRLDPDHSDHCAEATEIMHAEGNKSASLTACCEMR